MRDDGLSDGAPRLSLRSLYCTVRKKESKAVALWSFYLKHNAVGFERHLEVEGGGAWKQMRRRQGREITVWYYPHTSPHSSRHFCLDERCLTAAGECVLSRPEILCVFVVIWLLTCTTETKHAEGLISVASP